MNEKQLNKYESVCQEWSEWWGWEEGYTWEEGSDFFRRISEDLFTILDGIEVTD